MQIVERGTHTSLLRQRGIYYRLVSKQQYTKQELEQHQAELEQEQRKQMAASAPAVLSASAAVGGRGEVSQEAGRELQEGARNLVMGNAGADVDFEALSDIGGITGRGSSGDNSAGGGCETCTCLHTCGVVWCVSL